MLFDAIIIGLGAMGGAAAHQIAQRGKRVLGLERFTPVHDKGASHGGSRMIRQAYWEGSAYVPLLFRSYELWRRLERDTCSDLLHATGGLMVGPPQSKLITGCLRSVQEYGLVHEVLDSGQIRRRFPPLHANESECGVLESQAGYLLPEKCVRAQLAEAARYGAELHFEEAVELWKTNSGNSVTVRTSKATYDAEHLVITGGAWAAELLPDLALPLHVTRQVMFWFETQCGIDLFLPDRFPVFAFTTDDDYLLYGFPAIDGHNGGVKAAIHGSGEKCTPDSVDREIREADVKRIRTKLALRIPDLNSRVLKARVCMYNMTPDSNFIIGKHPHYTSVSVAVGFSGHGFKMASVVGEILADLVTQGTTSHDIAMFSPQRFNGATCTSPMSN